MRKIVSIMVVMFVSALSVWGHTQEFTYENVCDIISSLKDSQTEVLTQAKEAEKIDQSDKDKAEKVLNETFNNLDKVMSIYKQIEQNPDLKKEAQEIIVHFIKSYNSAILDGNKEFIQISSRRFITVAEESSPELDAFYKKAQEYIEKLQLEGSVADPKGKGGNETPVGGSENDAKDPKPESLNNVGASSLLAWIALGVGILSLLLSIIALVKINGEHNRINIRKQELEDAERRINQKISKLTPSSFRGTTSSYAPPQQSMPPQKPHQRKVQNPVTSLHRDDNTPRAKVIERPSVSYLYATIKAQSPYAEFFKVANENSGDKVFMLTVPNPEADMAEFTIAPNMSPDFMKSVIIDRDTYLPSLFCEKSIDSSNPTRIEVSSVGRAKKVDGKWQVQERMTIRLV